MPIVQSHNFQIKEWPGPPVKFWRFMPFHKFLDVMVHRRVFFPSQWTLRNDDAYEGYSSWPDFNNLPTGIDTSAAEAAINYVSCWHASEVEPAGLWKQYSDPSGGISIVSDKLRMIRAFSESAELLVPGLIDYSDGTPDGQAVETPVFRKRKHFISENELRIWLPSKAGAISHDPKTKEFFYVGPNSERSRIPSGKSVSCKVEELIESVVVGPKTEQWVFDAIKSFLEKLGYSLPLRYSEIAKKPT